MLKETKNDYIHVRVSKREFEEWSKIAEKKGISLSEYVRNTMYMQQLIEDTGIVSDAFAKIKKGLSTICQLHDKINKSLK